MSRAYNIYLCIPYHVDALLYPLDNEFEPPVLLENMWRPYHHAVHEKHLYIITGTQILQGVLTAFPGQVDTVFNSLGNHGYMEIWYSLRRDTGWIHP